MTTKDGDYREVIKVGSRKSEVKLSLLSVIASPNWQKNASFNLHQTIFSNLYISFPFHSLHLFRLDM